jgi:acyl-coenzyme A thioesterase PaaI-like protein
MDEGVRGRDGTLQEGETFFAFDTELDAQWSVSTKLHGGYLLAVLGRAAAVVTAEDHQHLTAISGSFIQAPEPGPAVAEVELLRAGRSASQLRARLSQGGRSCVEALITMGTLTEHDPFWSASSPVDLPDEQDCIASTLDSGAGFQVPLMGVVEQRLDPAVLGFAVGKPTGMGRVAGWQRLTSGEDWDPLSLLVAVDQVPPASFDVGLAGWVPTIQLSAYIRQFPAAGPVRVQMQATQVGDGRMDEVAHVWDSKDRLVAQATQIAAVRT